MAPKLISLDHLVLTVADIDRAVAFYVGVLGMVVERFEAADGTRRVALKYGTQKINLHQAGAEFEPKSERPTPGSADLCFVSEAPLSDWIAQLDAQGEAVLEGPVPRTGALGPMRSIYLRDPDQNLIEIAQYDR